MNATETLKDLKENPKTMIRQEFIDAANIPPDRDFSESTPADHDHREWATKWFKANGFELPSPIPEGFNLYNHIGRVDRETTIMFHTLYNDEFKRQKISGDDCPNMFFYSDNSIYEGPKLIEIDGDGRTHWSDKRWKKRKQNQRSKNR